MCANFKSESSNLKWSHQNLMPLTSQPPFTQRNQRNHKSTKELEKNTEKLAEPTSSGPIVLDFVSQMQFGQRHSPRKGDAQKQLKEKVQKAESTKDMDNDSLPWVCSTCPFSRASQACTKAQEIAPSFDTFEPLIRRAAHQLDRVFSVLNQQPTSQGSPRRIRFTRKASHESLKVPSIESSNAPSLPPSLIPLPLHIVEKSLIPPGVDTTTSLSQRIDNHGLPLDTTYNQKDKLWFHTLLPSSSPVGRENVTLLSK